MQEYKSLCEAVTICASLVNTQTTLWPAYMNRSASWAKSLDYRASLYSEGWRASGHTIFNFTKLRREISYHADRQAGVIVRLHGQSHIVMVIGATRLPWLIWRRHTFIPTRNVYSEWSRIAGEFLMQIRYARCYWDCGSGAWRHAYIKGRFTSHDDLSEAAVVH